MSILFLSKAEIEILTGRKRADAQIRQLKRRAISFELDADNKPVVIRQTITEQKPTERATEEPKLCFPNDKRKLKCVAAKPTPTYLAASTKSTGRSGT